MTSRFLFALALGTALAAAPVVAPGTAYADDAPAAPATVGAAVPQALMTGLAKHAAAVEEMGKRGAFTFTGKMEQLDGDGKASEVKEITVRSTPSATQPRVSKVIRYVEDGKDKTAEAQAKAEERKANHKASKGDKKALSVKLPFLANEQARYTFTVAERDPAQPGRVLIAFNPKVSAEDALKGTAWVDEGTQEVLSSGFSFSKNPTFVDYIKVTVVFGLPTPLGRAPSEVSFDAKGGLLFIRRHYRGTGRFSDPVIAF